MTSEVKVVDQSTYLSYTQVNVSPLCSALE